ncbi:hypothetical protein BSL78_25709 [Apostichopus japonicus]|uniref:Leucine-rich repeat and IQ domain-containing protein 3 n=1 Tax=Stichopus japonicus TaxID=307972 RepID=A0A2G8JP00_STIJA|nr:hypothetical protein BSL78_25709 [Apostichopus japonicus]
MLQTPNKNSQLVAWLQEQQKPHRLREVMAKERHLEFIKHAEDRGYLLSPSKGFLREQYSSDEGISSIDDILQVQLSNMRLKDVGDIGFCRNLQYCSLPGNYITNFEALKTCESLVRLDLHDNQISTLPGPKFWQCLPELKILYLHNNSVGRLSCLQNLGSSPNLQILTLFDTPISLKKSYRHHVVNSSDLRLPMKYFTLKALDFHVISDEEIIEDAEFGSHFSAMHNFFQYNPLLNLKKERSIRKEMETVRQILLQVSLIQAKHSPVIIIQRYIRGFLGRCRARRLVANRIWAAVAIQRYWRKYKGYKYASKKLKKRLVSGKGAKKASTPLEPKAVHEMSTLPAPSHAKSSIPSTTNREADLAVRSKLDYDTYMKNRRPGSISPGLQSLDNQRSGMTPPDRPQVAIVQNLDRNTPSPTGRIRANIMIDLTKLESAHQLVPIQSSISGIHQMGSATQVMVPNSSGLLQPQDIEKDANKLKAELSGSTPKKQRPITVHEMLGPQVDRNLSRETEDSWEEESPPIKFRIAGLKSVLHCGDLTQNLLIERRETGKDIRSAHRDVIDNIPRPKPLIRGKETS